MPSRKPKKKLTAATDAGGPGVRVRMYRSGLGDCFLVTFDPGGKEVHMLIDCGSLGATTTGVKLDQVVDDIIATTKNHLHLLIATHEHQDHVCGFRNCKDKFKGMTVDRVWLAWTENPRDENAKNIAKYKNDLGAALAAAARSLNDPKRSDATSAQLGAAIESILGFAGDLNSLGADGLAKTTDEAMTFVRTGFGKEAIYKSPGGAAIEEDWLPGFRLYILGPPTSEADLRDLGAHESEHLYHAAEGMRVSALAALAGYDDAESQMPFDPRLRIRDGHSLAAAAKSRYESDDDSWRRIDSDWLHAAADLALQLDSMTNNTSLALAIERVCDGRVLIFPADAQQGNWLSWHAPGMKWTYQDGATTREKTAEQLLNRAVFYKVGHHSSHNATAKAKGLEMMKQENELVAFIPVDRAVALGRNPKDSWQMPARPLFQRLLEKCQGRVVRSDIGFADDAKNAKDKETEKKFLNLADGAKWTEWKRAQDKALADGSIHFNRLYVDYILK